jgi:hypothetical protein
MGGLQCGLALAVALTSSGCALMAPMGGSRSTVVQRCWLEPRFEEVATPVHGERVVPVRPESREQMLCTRHGDYGEEQCRSLSAEEWAAWRAERTEVRQVGTIRQCVTERVQAQPVYYSRPTYRGGGGPVHVRGYYRNGRYVRPHTRSRPRR